MEQLLEAFNPANITEFDDLPILSDQFNKELLRVLDDLALERSISVSSHLKQPWYNDLVQDQHRIVHNGERMWLKYRLPSNWKAYKIERNIYQRLLTYKKCQFLSKRINECKGDTKKLYSIINTVTGSKQTNPMPPSNSDAELAESFADFFVTKIDKIREKFDGTDPCVPKEHEGVPSFTKFSVLSEADVMKLVMSLQTK